MHLIFAIFSCLCVTCSITYTAETECGVTEFTCANGLCINLAWRCDNDYDCLDDSDEKDCPSTTCAENFFRCANGKCIPERWVCDDSSECKDDSDEKPELCNNHTCSGYQCKSSRLCVPTEWKCDGYSDCPEKDDETECTYTCDYGTEFQCKDKKCISIRWRCDHHKDCDDGSDEDMCKKTDKTECETAGGEKMCTDGECLNELWWCDGDADCKDGSDEMNCTDKVSGETCEPTEFQCHVLVQDIQCIHSGWKCDGDDDCGDGSDEIECTDRTCSSDYKMCGSHFCIKAQFFCDREADCENGEDEVNCTYTDAPQTPCKDAEFNCGSKCIPYHKVCDGKNDCGNSSDELFCPQRENNSCYHDNGGCSQECIPNTSLRFGRRCACHTGFRLVSGSDTQCEDIDECMISGICSHRCINTKGSFKCECFMGYTLTNHRYCKASDGSHAEIILSDHHQLRRYSLDTYHYSLLLDHKVTGAVAMDFDIQNKNIFWTDVQSEKIFSANLQTGEVTVVIKDSIQMPDGLAVDWIHRNLYLSDTGLDRIEVARLDGTNRKTLVKEDLNEPRALVVDPSKGWIYWTDWGSRPKIEKCGMNGQHRKEIVTAGIAWPNGLTIDYIQQRLYWVDAKLHLIGSSDLNGNNYKVILRNHKNLGHPFAITVFEDYLYWTDWVSNAVHRYSKFGHDNMSTIALNLKTPMDIHVYHIYRQPFSLNYCGGKNGGCSHLCLPVPQLETSSQLSKKSECACPDSMILDGPFTCKEWINMILSPSGMNVTSTDHPETPRHSTKDTLKEVNETVVKSTTVKEQTRLKIVVNNTYIETLAEKEDVGLITGLVIGILVIFGLAVFGVIFLLLKRLKSRNMKSMNFDNPVYRKTTTEDHLTMARNGSLSQSLQPLNQEPDTV